MHFDLGIFFMLTFIYLCSILLFFLFIVIFITEEKIDYNFLTRIIVNYELYSFIDLLIDKNITEKENNAEFFFFFYLPKKLSGITSSNF